MHEKRTKIVCTIGPAVSTPEKIEELIHAGMNVARLNFSHGAHADHAASIKLLKDARKKLGVSLAIMLDTKGPEIRLGKLDGDQMLLKDGDQFFLVKEKKPGQQNAITITPPSVLDALSKEMFVLLDNGYIITHVVELGDGYAKVSVDHGGIIRSTKGVNIPGLNLDLPSMTQKDIADIKFGCEQDIDLIAASFIRTPEDVIEIKKLLEEQGKSQIQVLAKIENRQGVQNIDSIIQVADGIMIARGDLGVELPLTEVPRLQKMMIRKCFLAGKPSVTATQMLESMMVNPRPTRAEASDVANAIYDSTSAVMLSGETAVGSYPIETVKVMRAIIEESERDFNYYDFLKQGKEKLFPDVPSSVTFASIRTAYSTNARAIFAFTTTGFTARLLSRFRPEMPIIAMTPHEKVYHQLSLMWGVIPVLNVEAKTIENAYSSLCAFSLERGYAKLGDLVVITAGTTFGKAGTTNMMMIDSIGDVLVRGSEGIGESILGKIALVTGLEGIKPYIIKGKIIVITRCDANYIPFLTQAAGVILDNHVDDIESEWFLKKWATENRLPAILRAEGATAVLRSEQHVTLDPAQCVVCKGS